MKFLKISITWVATFYIFKFAWIYLETMELGYTLKTIIDSVMCMFLTSVVVWIMWVLDE